MSTYAEASAAVSGDKDVPYGRCAAPGCCLPGVLSTSTQGPKAWWCTVHVGLPRAEHDGATALVANRRELWQIALQLVGPQPFGMDSAGLHARVKALRPELLKQAHARDWSLGAHMIAVLLRECRMPQAHMGTPKTSPGTSWLDASHPKDIDA